MFASKQRRRGGFSPLKDEMRSLKDEMRSTAERQQTGTAKATMRVMDDVYEELPEGTERRMASQSNHKSFGEG